MKIDFVSDVACPWCAVGLHALEAALARLEGEIDAELHFQPFELNPQMPPEGEDTVEHLAAKYGLTAVQIEHNQAALRARGQSVGFEFGVGKRKRIYNTFDAHRLLYWAGLEGAPQQRALKHALLTAYFTHGENPGDPGVLLRCAAAAGLEVGRARQIIESQAYADDVRQRERYYAEQGIQAVPSVIIDGRHLIQGGQPVEVFERALRQLAAADQTA